MAKIEQNIGVLIVMIAVVVIAACGDPKNRVNGTTLTASMTDQEIIKAFGLDPATATSKKVNGKDGVMMNYSAGEQEVNITRSTVTGVSVFATGPVKGVWSLGSP